MPTTETQPSAGQSSPPPPEPTRTRRGSRRDYEGLDAFDLLHVIDDLEDERARALLREKIWIALLLHIAIFAYLLFAPKYIYHVKIVDPSTRLREQQKEMTFLDLPKDALKQVRPKNAPAVSDKNRVQPAPNTTLDRKTLEAMRRAEPPTPKPAPQQPTPPAPLQAQQAPPPVQRPAQPLPQNQTSQVEAPAPRPTQPNFNSGAVTPGEAVQQAARRATSGGSYSDGDLGANAPSPHGGMNGGVDVLSDTLGVDFGPYIQRVIYDTKQAWYPIIPPSAQPPLSKQGRVLIRFKILPDGSVKNMILEGPSGDVSLDRAAWGGITGGSPFPQLPKNFKGPYLELRFYFLYNERPGVQ
jgi:TonB family protein